ncbi:MAG TPA: hypothetical protein PLO61_08190 [Fimbriimonadaceae bacterium]|nr:hypothetical protein [Fimbriimonadaceae bacterium]
MRDLSQRSGLWTGMSVQMPRRVMERIDLHICGTQLVGTGEDVDGDFLLDGVYDPATRRVEIARRYTRTTRHLEFDPSLVSFQYEGIWDGQMITGTWYESFNEVNTGPFEMWPSDEEVAVLELEFSELTAQAT